MRKSRLGIMMLRAAGSSKKETQRTESETKPASEAK